MCSTTWSSYLLVGEPSLACDQGFTLHGAVCYKVDGNSEVSWAEAETACNQLPGGHLAAIHSQDDYNLLKQLMASQYVFISLETSDLFLPNLNSNECPQRLHLTIDSKKIKPFVNTIRVIEQHLISSFFFLKSR